MEGLEANVKHPRFLEIIYIYSFLNQQTKRIKRCTKPLLFKYIFELILNLLTI